MKKVILAVLFVLFTGSLGFAKARVEIGGGLIGFGYDFNLDPFSEGKKSSLDKMLIPPFGNNLCLNFTGEFASDDLKPFHFFAGAELGTKLYVLGYGKLTAGFSYHLTDTEKKRLELATTLGMGIGLMIPIRFSGISVDLQILSPNRSGFFTSFGLNSEVLFMEAEYYKKFGLELYLLGIADLHASVGWRF